MNRTATIAGRGDEDGGDGVTAGLLVLLGGVGRKSRSRQSFGRRRGDEAVVVAAANGVGGDGAPLGGGEREPEKGGEARGECEAWEGAWRRGRGPGRREKAGGGQGSRRWPRPLGRAPRLGPSGEEEDDRGSGDGLGRGGPGKWAPGKLGRWPGGLLSLSFISI